MAEETSQPAQPSVNVLAQYIRDLSFENILAQKGVSGDVTPDIQIQVKLDARKRSVTDQYETVIKLNIDSKSKDTNDQLFLLEIEYAGVFTVTGVPDEQLHPFLMIECPRMIFPFLRRVVSDLTQDGGFPALNLETIDFMQLYRSEALRRQTEAASEETTTISRWAFFSASLTRGASGFKRCFDPETCRSVPACSVAVVA